MGLYAPGVGAGNTALAWYARMFSTRKKIFTEGEYNARGIFHHHRYLPLDMVAEMKTTRAHVRYKTAKNKQVPGVTTILGVLDKPALLPWAWGLGMKGIDYRKARDHAGNIGTLTHYRIQCELAGEEPDLSTYSPAEIDKSDNAMLSWWEWRGGRELVPLLLEVPLVSECWHYGGTIDCYCVLDGRPTLLDFKTSKKLYPDYLCQVTAYYQLLLEHDYKVDDVRILRIGRDETEGFEDRKVANLDKYWEVFSSCLKIYKLKKELNWR